MQNSDKVYYAPPRRGGGLFSFVLGLVLVLVLQHILWKL